MFNTDGPSTREGEMTTPLPPEASLVSSANSEERSRAVSVSLSPVSSPLPLVSTTVAPTSGPTTSLLSPPASNHPAPPSSMSSPLRRATAPACLFDEFSAVPREIVDHIFSVVSEESEDLSRGILQTLRGSDYMIEEILGSLGLDLSGHSEDYYAEVPEVSSSDPEQAAPALTEEEQNKWRVGLSDEQQVKVTSFCEITDGTSFQFGLDCLQGHNWNLEMTLERFFQGDLTLSSLTKFHFHRGIVLYEENRMEEAFVAFSEAIRLDPRNSVPYFNRAITLESLHRYEEALLDYAEAIRLDPNTFQFYFNRGVTLSSLNRNEEALSDFTEAIRLDPTNCMGYFNRALTLRDLYRYDEALLDINEAIRIDPTNAKAYYSRAIIFRYLHRYEEALLDDTEVIRLDPTDSDAFLNRAATLGSLKRHEEALLDATEVIRLDPMNSRAYYNRAVNLGSLHRYEEALVDNIAAIRLDPTNVKAYYNRAIILRYLHRYEEALLDNTEAIRRDPSFGPAYYNAGISCFDCVVRSVEKGSSIDLMIDRGVDFFLRARNFGEFHMIRDETWVSLFPHRGIQLLHQLFNSHFWRYSCFIIRQRMSEQYISPMLTIIDEGIGFLCHLAVTHQDEDPAAALLGLTCSDLNKSLSTVTHAAGWSDSAASFTQLDLDSTLSDLLLDLTGLNGCILAYHLIQNAPNCSDSIVRWIIRDGQIVHFDRCELPDEWNFEETVSSFGTSVSHSSSREVLRGMIESESEGGCLRDTTTCTQSIRTSSVSTSSTNNRHLDCRRLYDLLLGGLEAFLPENILPNDNRQGFFDDEVITIIPDKTIFRVPFGCLLDSEGVRFVEKCAFIVCPSIRLLQFMSEGSRIVRSDSSVSALVCRNDSPKAKKLASTGTEISKLVRIFSSFREESVICLSGSSSSVSAIECCVRDLRPRFIHIAGHSTAVGPTSSSSSPPSDEHSDKCTPDLSSEELLRDYQRTGRILCYDDCLHASEFADRFDLRSTELVFLSSCALGDGNLLVDGMNGFYRACIEAGCPAVVCSLWPVLDKVSARVAVMFWQGIVHERLDPARALRRAVLTCVERMKLRDESSTRTLWDFPSLWAGFQVFATEMY